MAAAPSLYAAFGSKEQLFVRALQRYGQRYREQLDMVLAKDTTYEVIESYLRPIADTAPHGDVPGCLSIQGGLACGPNNAHIPRLLAEYRQGLEDTVAKALAATTDVSQRPDGFDTAALADYVVTVGQGLAVHAGAGTPQSRLDAIVDVALAGVATLLGEQLSSDTNRSVSD
ncbi:TetR/AcrR family transcriptional regulator [Mycobacterium sp. C31M]